MDLYDGKEMHWEVLDLDKFEAIRTSADTPVKLCPHGEVSGRCTLGFHGCHCADDAVKHAVKKFAENCKKKAGI